MSEQMWIDRAQAAVGDADTIIAAAWFNPRGTAGGIVGGSTIGGDGVSGALLSIAGSTAGYAAEKIHDDHLASKGSAEPVKVPFMAVVAVSATRIYAWRTGSEHLHNMPGDLLFAHDRDQVAITVHSRVSVRTFEVEDLHTGQKWEFESPRLTGHLKFVLDALHADTVESDPTPETAPATSG